jgi:hypothetical protein
MLLMSLFDKLPKLPKISGKKETPRENFFALHVGFEEVTGAVWSMQGNRVYLLSTANSKYQDGDDFKSDKSQKSLIQAANQSLDEALADITPEPDKLLFGVPDAWLVDENIKADYLKLLKRLVKELGVAPMAYVSTTHAISHLLQKQTGVPVSAVIVEVSDPITVTVIKGGKMIGWISLMASKNIADSVEKALSTMHEIEVLPSRMLLFGKGDLSSVKDSLAEHTWQQLPFLHLPKIEVLPPQVENEAIAFAGASELNPDIIADVINHATVAVSAVGLSHKLAVDDEEESEEEEGFPELESENQKIGRSEDRIEDLEDSGEFEEQEEWEEEAANVPVRRRGDGEEGALDEEYGKRDGDQESVLGRLSAMALAPFRGLSKSEREVAVAAEARSPIDLLTNKLVIIPFLLVIGLGMAYYFVPKAKVSVFVDMKPFEKSAQVIADPNATSVDSANNIIPGKIVDIDESGSGDGTATGTKQIGDPAKGAVVIYNKTNSPVTLSKGTELDGPNHIAFTLDDTVNVASQSAVEGGISYGKAPGNATAKAIGPDGNIPAGAEMTVAGKGNTDVSAKADSAFSGGVSKNVTVVSDDDEKKLLAQVTSDLRTKASTDMKGKLTGDLKVLPEALQESVTKKTYTKNVGDQATKFSLNVTAHYKGTAYSENDLKSIVSKLVQTDVPNSDHYIFDPKNTETSSNVSKVDKDGKVYFNAKFSAKLMPKFDLNSLATKIVGLTPDDAEKYLKQQEPTILSVKFDIFPPIPAQVQRLPLRKEAISLDVTAK